MYQDLAIDRPYLLRVKDDFDQTDRGPFLVIGLLLFWVQRQQADLEALWVGTGNFFKRARTDGGVPYVDELTSFALYRYIGKKNGAWDGEDAPRDHGDDKL